MRPYTWFILLVSFAIVSSISFIAAEENPDIYLIAGNLYADKIILHPIMPLQGSLAESEQSINSNNIAEFYGETSFGNSLLKTFRFNVPENSNDPLLRQEFRFFMFMVDMPSNTNKIAIKEGSTILKEFYITKNKPVINSLNVAEDGNNYKISWSVTDLDNDGLLYSLYYSNDNGQDWNLINFNMKANTYLLDISKLSGGNLLLRILASDGFNIAEKTSGPFYIPTKSPTPFITYPLDGSEYTKGSDIFLEGFGYDPEDGFLEEPLSWSLDNNILGTGSYLITNNLSLGQHTITLTATDSEGKTAKETRNMAVTTETKPDVTIKELKTYPAELRETEPGRLEGSAFIQAKLFNIRSDAFCDVSVYGESGTAGNTTADTANLDEGLVLYMPFDEGSGSVAYDSSGNNNNGAINGAKYAEGKVGKALSFDGNDYIKFSATNMPAGERTIGLWFYTTDTSATRQLLGYGGNSNNPAYSSFIIYLSADKRTIIVHRHYPDGDIFSYTSSLPMVDSWYYLVFTSDSSGSKLYLNGKLVTSNNIAISTYVSAKDGFIGAIPSGSGVGTYVDSNYLYWNGIIDEVRIYNRALSAEEIKQVYDAKSFGLLESKKIYLPANSLGYAYATFTPAQTGDYDISVKVFNCYPEESETSNNEASALLRVLPYDTIPPSIVLGANPSILWPPNNKPVDVTISGSITDDISGVNKDSVNLIVDGISKEIILDSNGGFNTIVPLIAKRAGQEKDGHQYYINMTASDNAGNNAITSAAVIVPHDERK